MNLNSLSIGEKFVNEDGIVFRKTQNPAKFVVVDHGQLDVDGWRINDEHNFKDFADKDLIWIAEEKIWFAD
jgi:hypothetical protein